MPGKRRAHYAGDYPRRAAAVRAAAYGDASTRCWRCGLTLEEHPRTSSGRHARWQAGHVNDGEVGGALLPEADVCNASRGASMGNARRSPRSREW